MRRAVVGALAVLACLPAAPARADDPAFYVFRTRDTGEPPTPEQHERCDAHFGPRSATTATRLNARLFGFRSDPASGRVVDQTASLLGPGFICAAPHASATDPLEAYAYTSLPGPGLVELTGPCQLPPVVARPGAAILNCHLQIRPDAARAIDGGLVTSNSLVNLADRGEDAPTGSVWTAQLLGSAQAPAGLPVQPIPPGIRAETPGLDFYVTRTTAERVATTAPGCASGGAGVRVARLETVQPDLATGRVPDAAGPPVGALTVCYSAVGGGRYRATASAVLKAAAGDFPVTASGECRDEPTPAGATLRAQSCALSLDASRSTGVQGGLLTSTGLVPAGAPAAASGPSVWTFSLFGAPPGTPRADAPAPSLVVSARRRVRGSRVRVTARPTGLAAPVTYRLSVGRRSAGRTRWLGPARATRARAVRVRLPRPGLHVIHVRATAADGTRASASVLVRRVA